MLVYLITSFYHQHHHYRNEEHFFRWYIEFGTDVKNISRPAYDNGREHATWGNSEFLGCCPPTLTVSNTAITTATTASIIISTTPITTCLLPCTVPNLQVIQHWCGILFYSLQQDFQQQPSSSNRNEQQVLLNKAHILFCRSQILGKCLSISHDFSS